MQKTIKFQDQYLNLDTNEIVDAITHGRLLPASSLLQHFSFNGQYDQNCHIWVSYNDSRAPHSVLFHNRHICEIAKTNTEYDSVDLKTAQTESYQINYLTIPFEGVFLIKTGNGFFKFIRISETNDEVVLKYEKL